jgi:isopenicillin N synthase-like dioxygenase
MPNILTVDYRSSSLGKDFATSLQTTGFAVIKNHPISYNLISSVYDEWKNFFNLKFKHNYLFHPVKQDGYFPYLSENAKDCSEKDLKEFYHIYDWGRYPSEISDRTNQLVKEFKIMAEKLLFEIQANTPSEVKNSFSITLDKMIQKSAQNLLRIIHYPPLTGDEDSEAIRAGAHEDINLITLLLSGTQPGLQVKTKDNKWLDVESNQGYLIVNIGDMLQECSNGYYPSTTHRVINPQGKNVSRYSMPFFVHARDEVILSDQHTAKSYLEERLKEIGLK